MLGLRAKSAIEEVGMNRNVLVALGIMVVLGVISEVLTYLRAEKMSPVSDIATKGLAAVQRGNLTFFGVFIPVLVGVCSFLAYRTLLARSPATAQTSYLLLAIGIGVALSIAAAVVFKMRGFVEFTVLHVIYIGGFGWLMPLLWVR
jgi:hypothetical protein